MACLTWPTRPIGRRMPRCCRVGRWRQVTIGHPRSAPEHTIPDCVAVGLSDSRFPLKGKMPGWDAASYGYHSDDGGAFHDAGSMLFK